MKKYLIFSILSLVFISLNLRAAITSIGQLASVIMQEFELSSSAFGILNALPLICFFIFSQLAVFIQPKKCILLALLLIIFGLFLRIFISSYFLFASTIIVACGIAFLNVLMPAFVKNNFKNTAKYMAIYSFILSLSGLFGTFSYHIYREFGLKIALFIWIIFAIFALFCFLPFCKNKRLNRAKNSFDFAEYKKIFANKSAWIITIFMGIQSCIFYTTIAWLPSILEHKLNPLSAANIMIFFQILTIFSAFFVPILMLKIKRQNFYLTTICFCDVLGFLLCKFSDNLYILWLSAAIFSLPIGGIFAIALSMIASKSKNMQTTTYLSSMAQSFGYLIAAIGPIIFGFFRHKSGDYELSINMMIILSFLLIFFAIKSNKIDNI